MNQRHELEQEYVRLVAANKAIGEMPPSDERAAARCKVDKIKNYIIYSDKLISERKDVGVIMDRIHELIDELITSIA